MAKLSATQKAASGAYGGYGDWDYGSTGFDPGDYGADAHESAIADIPASMQPILPGQFAPTPVSSTGETLGHARYSKFRQEQLSQSSALARASNQKSGFTSLGGGFAEPTAVVQYSKTVGGGAVPELETPEWDEDRIAQLRRKISGPAVRQLRRGLREALSATYENPNVRRMVVREALAGYGIGLGAALAKGEQAAVQQYGQEYARQYQRAVDSYKAAMDKYMREATTLQTTQKFYSDEEVQDFIKTLEK